MNKCNVIGIDLAKSTFQICIVNHHQKVLSNKPLRRAQLAAFLAKQPRALVVFEACSRAHYWARQAQHDGHETLLIPPKQVSAYRQGHKTDANDALAIAVAAKQPGIKPAGQKTLEQQSLQSESRIGQHVSDQLTATGNLLRGLLAEFGIEIPKGKMQIKKHLPWILENADNELPLAVRESLNIAWQQWQQQYAALTQLDKLLATRVNQHPTCQQLKQMESVGPKNALGLYIALGNAKQFKNGREAAACIGLTPKQHSSGGKTKIGSIGKYQGCQRLRSSLILGAHSVIIALDKREPHNDKERWLKKLIQRRGKGRAAVALANKTVRTAWAMCYYNEPYRPTA